MSFLHGDAIGMVLSEPVYLDKSLPMCLCFKETYLVKSHNFLHTHVPVERSYASKILKYSNSIPTTRVQSGVEVSLTGSCFPNRKGTAKMAHNLTAVLLSI